MIVGDCVDSECPVWEYYICLRDLVNLLLIKHATPPIIDYMESVISEHHEMYMSVFNLKLKPKHHHLVHYPAPLRKLGVATKYYIL